MGLENRSQVAVHCQSPEMISRDLFKQVGCPSSNKAVAMCVARQDFYEEVAYNQGKDFIEQSLDRKLWKVGVHEIYFYLFNTKSVCAVPSKDGLIG